MNKEEKQESRRLPGFYIALCCCVIAVGIAGYFTERASDGTDNAPQNIGPDTSLAQPEIVADNTGDNTVAANADAENVENNRMTNPSDRIYVEPKANNASSEAEEASAPQVIYEDLTAQDAAEDEEAEEAAAIIATPTFAMPASGEIIEEYSDTLSYNSALGDWRTHNGTDIAVDAGGSVCAAADGTISRISSDAMGEYVIIEHSGGFSTKYCSLSSVEDIAEGSAVKSGDVIGIVADNRTENAQDTHLHFELYKDGSAVNPLEYIK